MRNMNSGEYFDCIIVGSGIAGLVAARNLHREKFSVLVLEAHERYGGRMYGERLASGQWIDRGGQWVGPTQDRFLALLDEYGVRRFPSPTQGRKVLLFDNKRYEFDGFFQGYYEGERPKVSEEEWQDAVQGWHKFEALAARMSPGFPDATPQNCQLDSQTFADWINQNLRTPFGKWYFEYMGRAVGYLGPAEPKHVSLLHMLVGHKTAAQTEQPEAELLHGGAGQIPEKIVDELRGRVRVGEPVVKICQSVSGVEVYTLQGKYSSQYVIVAMPPYQAGRISYEPPMPSLRSQLTQRMPMGCCAKLLITYDRPFWREQGLAGIGMGNCDWIELCADSSDPETGVGVLATFVVGDRYKKWCEMRYEDRKNVVVSDLARYFGEKALRPVTYSEVDWPGEPWVGGGYAAFMPPGVWTSYGEALNKPVGRIHWAGTEVSDRWAGFFDGAIRTGEESSRAVASLLRAQWGRNEQSRM